jgi:ubiquinone/menaquinone biosynthesis C-methylase UbiE
MAPEHPLTPPPGWMLDEIASAGRENLDVGHVAHYDAKENADADAELLLCEGLGLQPDATVVDLGAGTGQFALAAAAAAARVVAADVSPAMLERLRTKRDDAGLTNLEIVNAGFLSYEHRGPKPDLVYSRLALHHLPDAWKALALARIARMLSPGGAFRLLDVVYSFEPSEAQGRLEAWCASAEDNGIEHDWSRAELEEHVREEHSTFSWLLEPMIERSGLRIEDASYSADGIFASYVLRPA